MSDSHPFAVGSVVQLKSGGPKMTVIDIHFIAGKKLECMWFDSENVLHRWLKKELLTLEPAMFNLLQEAVPIGPIISIGDSVKLPSGGPSMSILSLAGHVATCIWFANDKGVLESIIPIKALQPAGRTN